MQTLGASSSDASLKHLGLQCRYTHVLKTDDDCYIRYSALEATLLQPPTGEAASKKAHMQMQMSAVYMGKRTLTPYH